MSARAYADPTHPGNGMEYRTGKVCIEPGCDEPAGTWWSPLWCFAHNVKRIDRINAGLKAVLAQFEADSSVQSPTPRAARREVGP